MKIVIFEEMPQYGGANSYVIYDEDTKDAVVFDPGSSRDPRIEQFLDENDLNLDKIILTHGHYDHIDGVEKLKEKTGAKVYIPEGDKDFLTKPSLNLSAMIGMPDLILEPADVIVKEGDTIELTPGNEVTVIETPGHTPGSASFIGDGFVIVGDVLFQGSIGRTDFPGSSYSDMINSLDKLLQLDDDVVVLSGHGNPTTIGQERKYNPFLN